MPRVTQALTENFGAIGKLMWSVIPEDKSYDSVLVEALLKSEQLLGEEVHNLYVDTLVTTVGNRFAYSKIEDTPVVHVRADLNEFGAINREYGFKVGDQVLQVFGKLVAEVAAANGGQAYRYGGDEFHFTFENPEDAHLFCRQVRQVLEASPLYESSYVSAAFGIGENAISAVTGMIRAKESLYHTGGKPKFDSLQAPNVFYSTYDL